MTSRIPLIAIDALGINQPGGPRTAVLYLLDNLFRIRPKWRYMVFVSQKETLFSRYPYVIQIKLPVTKGIFARLVMQILAQITVWLRKVDLVHFTKSQGGILVGSKNVLTIFDVTVLRYPKIHNPIAVWFWRNIQPFIAKQCDAIVTLSENAAQDISELLHIQKRKIHVIPCATIIQISDISFNKDINIIREKYKIPEEYMLSVGALALKKNLSTLIKALAYLQEQKKIFPPLILVGPKYRLSDGSAILSLINNLNLQKQVQYIGAVQEADLIQIYRGAKIFLFPSFHEGFGIPCLEAMACHIPVLASNAASIPEVIGDGGLLIQEYMSPHIWAESIYKLLNDTELQNKLIEKGQIQVQKFSWNLSAHKLATLYERLLDLDKEK